MSRFLAKVQFQRNGCWLWIGATGGKPPYFYGVFQTDKLRIAHRLIYEHVHGPIPVGMVIDHTCQMKLCVNPEHLRICTQRENLHASSKTLNSRNSALTHCKNGHKLEGDNIRMYRNQRVCRACKREWASRNRNKQ
jgi:hypothetical protein